MPQQTGRYVLCRCVSCGTAFPVHFRGAAVAKYCPDCGRKIQHTSADEYTKRARRETKRRLKARAERLARRDATFPSQPSRIECRDGKIVESRGVIPGGTRSGSATVFFSPIYRYLYKA